MQSQKYLANYKCECYGRDYCNCPQKDAANAIFLENVYDVADALVEIMIICGIHPCKSKATVDVIIYSFLHYDEIRHRIDTVPRKRLCKEDLIHDLGRKCLMNRMEAQLTYSIIKRAFKAFYHGTTEGGIRNPEMEAQLIHTQECMWVHAAKRTAQIFASYEGMFFAAQKLYESQIKCVYKKLYDRLQQRASPIYMSDCLCKGCLKRAIVGDPKYSGVKDKPHSVDKPQSTDKPEQNSQCAFSLDACQLLPKSCDAIGSVAVEQEKVQSTVILPEQRLSQMSLQLPQCYKCNCPKLICDCEVDRNTGVLTADCSQGPYKCQWIRVDDEEPVDTGIEIPEDHQCPVDCDEVSVSCDPECQCNCMGICECALEDNSSDFEMEDESASHEGKGEGEENSLDQEASELSGYGGCCVINHIVEEMTMSANPTSIAKVVGHKLEASVKSEQIHVPKPNSGNSPVTNRSLKPQSEEDKRKENEEISFMISRSTNLNY